MDNDIKIFINKKLISLVDFILEKNPNANKNLINHKINKLFFETKVVSNHNIINSISEQKPVIKVCKSPFLNYVLTVEENDQLFKDLKTNKFVMDIESKKIIGIENSEGEIEPLNSSLIEICHKYKLRFQIPLNLNVSDEPVDVIIDNNLQELGLNIKDEDDDNEEE